MDARRGAEQTPTPEAADAAFAGFVALIPRAARVVCLHDTDADGITAGVLWQRAFERMDFTDIARVLPGRERNAWSGENRAKVAAVSPAFLFVLDLGSQTMPVIAGVPTCFIDHHRPEGVPPGDTLISAYHGSLKSRADAQAPGSPAWDPIPCTSLLIYQVAGSMVDLSDLDWVAAIGALSDLGDNAPFPLIAEAKKKYTAKYLREATSLVNAARRSSRYIPEFAADALLSARSPKELVEADTPAMRELKTAREEVKAALNEAKKAAPVFAGQVALIRIHSACVVHPLIAQIWRSRLPKFLVIVANDGYRPGRVHFSARSGPGTNVIDFLRGISLPAGDGDFGHGHDQASGGVLPTARWNALLAALGFPESVFAPAG